MLKILIKDEDSAISSPDTWIVNERYSIGSDPSNDLVIDHPSVSPHHADLVTVDNQLFLKDNNSKFGSYVNDERVIEEIVTPHDAIKIGRVELAIIDSETLEEQKVEETPLIDEWALVSCGPWLPGKQFPIGPCAWIVGRDDGCDIMLPSKRVSRRHAEFSLNGNYLHVTDLASRNGTFINDAQISSGVLQAGDKIRFASFLFDVVGPKVEVDDDRTLLQKLIPPLAKRRLDNSLVTGPKQKNVVAQDEAFRASLNIKEEPAPLVAVAANPVAVEKQWKTRPTSPGNRAVELPPEKTQWWSILTVASIILAALTLGYIGYLLVFQFDRLI